MLTFHQSRHSLTGKLFTHLEEMDNGQKKKIVRTPKSENGRFLYYCTVPGCTFGTDNFAGLVGHSRMKHGINIKKNGSQKIAAGVPIKKEQVEITERVETITESPKEDVMEGVDRGYVDQMLRNQGESVAKDIQLLRQQIESKVDEIVRQSKLDSQKSTAGIAENVQGITSQLDGMQKTVQSLFDAQKASEEIRAKQAQELEAMKAELASRPSEERVQELMTTCINDPDSPACQFLAGMVRNTAEEIQLDNGLHVHGEDGQEVILPETTWDEVLECTEGCKDGICEALPNHPEVLSEALKKVGEQDKEKLAKLVSEAGLEAPTSKPKNPKLDSLFQE